MDEQNAAKTAVRRQKFNHTATESAA